jgi:electron transfer flavoprotein alpha subunit
MSSFKNILIVAEAAAAGLTIATRELVTLARDLASASGGRVAGVVLGDSGAANALVDYGVERVYRASITDIHRLPVEARLPIIEDAYAREQPQVVLLTHGVIGAELAPRLAFRQDACVATGCVEVRIEDGSVLCTRPCYGGLAREVDAIAKRTVFASIRAGGYEPAATTNAGHGEIIELAADPNQATRTSLIERKLEATDGVRLEDARVVVAGGRGLDGPAGFEVLATLADELGGALAASRVACDLGWCPHSWQVGLTGKTVTPDIYFAIGISGAGHHMAGCGNAKTIVAINTDPDAAIFQDARFGVIGDYREVVPALVAVIRKHKLARQCGAESKSGADHGI